MAAAPPPPLEQRLASCSAAPGSTPRSPACSQGVGSPAKPGCPRMPAACSRATAGALSCPREATQFGAPSTCWLRSSAAGWTTRALKWRGAKASTPGCSRGALASMVVLWVRMGASSAACNTPSEPARCCSCHSLQRSPSSMVQRWAGQQRRSVLACAWRHLPLAQRGHPCAASQRPRRCVIALVGTGWANALAMAPLEPSLHAAGHDCAGRRVVHHLFPRPHCEGDRWAQHCKPQWYARCMVPAREWDA